MSEAVESAPFRWPSRAELSWAAGFAAVVMALTCLPYAYGLLIRPDDTYYSGLLTNPDEHNVYLAYMKQVKEGAFFLIDPFTSEPQAGRVVNVFFLALGLVSRVPGLTLPLVYHVARVVSGWLLLMAIYCLGAQAIRTVWGRRLALWLAAFASGLGWLFHTTGGQPHPVDFGPGLVMPEAITFLSLLLNPLFCFSVFLMVTAIGLGAQAMSAGSARSAVLAGVAALVLGNIHTYDVIPVAVTLAAFLVVILATRAAGLRAVGMAAVIAAIASPSLLYQLWLVKSGEVTLAVKTVETPVYSPSPVWLALGLGLPLALGLAGAGMATRRGAARGARLLALWSVLGFALAYAPAPFQRKLAQGIQVPAVLLAAAVVEWTMQRRVRLRGLVGVALVAVTLPSSFLFVSRAMRDLQTNNAAYVGNLMPSLYLGSDEYEALRWLDENADRRDVVLCNSFLGSYAPSLAGTRVYVGHWAETLHFRDKLGAFSKFLRADTPDSSREAFVRREGITYVLRDRSMYDDVFRLSQAGEPLPAFDPERVKWLTPVYREGGVSLYRVE